MALSGMPSGVDMSGHHPDTHRTIRFLVSWPVVVDAPRGCGRRGPIACVHLWRCVRA